MQYIKINNEILPEDKAFISVKERACRFGDGVFETCRVTSGIIYNFEEHLARLKEGLKSIRINYDLTKLKKSAYGLIKKNRLTEGSIRIYISRGIGSIGYLPKKTAKPLLIIETSPLSSKKAQSSVMLYVSSITRTSASSLPVNYKLSQGLNLALAAMEARDNKCFDSLMVNDLGEVCETTTANVFWIKNDILYTSAEGCGVLLGTIRKKIISMSPIPVRLVRDKLSQLITSDEVFISNAVLGVLHVRRVNPKGKKFHQKKYSQIFRDLINQDVLDYVQKEKSNMA